ncbi:hypothetical protein [Halorubrum gandharaense]
MSSSEANGKAGSNGKDEENEPLASLMRRNSRDTDDRGPALCADREGEDRVIDVGVSFQTIE